MMRFLSFRVGLSLAAAVALIASISVPADAQSRFADMSENERAAFRAEIRAFLLEEPEIVTQALRVLDHRQITKAIAELEASVSAGRYVRKIEADGADLTLIELTDYDCPYCRRSQPEIADFLTRDGGVTHVVKMLPFIGGDLPERAALAAKLQADRTVVGAFHLAMMGVEGRLTPEGVERIARAAGLDWARLIQDMNSPEVEQQLAQNIELARALRVQGTPAFIIGGEVLSGLHEADQFLQIADQLRAAN